MRRQRIIYSIILSAFILLGGLYLWNVLFLKQLERQMIHQLTRQASFTSQLAARMFDGSALETIQPGDEASPTVLYTQQLLWELTTEEGVTDAFILSLDGHLLVDSRATFTIGDSLIRLPIDNTRWLQAINGKTPPPDLLSIDSGFVLITYTPILNPIVGNPVAVLLMQYPTRFFDTFIYFKKQVIIIILSGIGILLAFSGLIIWSIRQLIRAERTVLEQHHLAELGQMSAMVAHEIRNPLSIIKGSADVLRKQYRQENNELFDFIPEEIDRLNRLVTNFLTFARKRTLELRPIVLYPLLEHQCQLLKDARIHLTGEKEVKVWGDEDALKQVFLNVLTNARKAIEPRGETGKIEIQVAFQRRGKYVLTSVRDNGTGMDASTLARVFEPFFSHTATGSGLGLTITRQLVTRMGGKIEIESKPEQGTVVYIWLKESR